MSQVLNSTMSADLLAANFFLGPDEASLGILILRVAVGLTMAAHGYAKYCSGGRIAGTASWFNSMGMRLDICWSLRAMLLLALGLLTPFAALAFVALMTVAAYTVHLKNGFFIVKGGYEYNFVLAVIAIAIATTGPGKYSLDCQLDLIQALDGWTGLLIAAVGGVGAGAGQLMLFYRPPAE